MPTLIRGCIEVEGLGKWTDLVNWRILSIVISFAAFANSYYTIRYLVFSLTKVEFIKINLRTLETETRGRH